MDSGIGSWTKNVFLLSAAATGGGCLAFYAWNNYQQFRNGGSSNDNSNRGLKSNTNMGQNRSVPFSSSGNNNSNLLYSPVENGSDEISTNGNNRNWSITVNPREALEEGGQSMISDDQDTIDINRKSSIPPPPPPRFKRVILRSPTTTTGQEGQEEQQELEDQAAAESVVTNQPRSQSQFQFQQFSRPQHSKSHAPAITTTNLRLADKLRGFSNEEYQNTLQGTLNRLYGSTKILTTEEAKCLTLVLQQKAPDSLLKVLTTMSNLAAFTVNQDLLKEHGAIELLIELLEDDLLSDSARVMLVQCVGNMAVNQTNNKLLQCCVPRIIHQLLAEDSSELQRFMCVQALTNLSVDTSQCKADQYATIIPVLYQRLSSRVGVNVATLRLLVNLSCVADLVPVMLAEEVPLDLLDVIETTSSSQQQDVLVRATTFLFYLVSTADSLNLDEKEIMDIRSKSSRTKSNLLEESLFYKLLRGAGLRRFKQLAARLKSNREEANEEVSQRMARILRHLNNLEEQQQSSGLD